MVGVINGGEINYSNYKQNDFEKYEIAFYQ
jgi:hypothetical protein